MAVKGLTVCNTKNKSLNFLHTEHMIFLTLKPRSILILRVTTDARNTLKTDFVTWQRSSYDLETQCQRNAKQFKCCILAPMQKAKKFPKGFKYKRTSLFIPASAGNV